jgi:hypothetical protein
MWHAWETGETCTGFWWESLRERDNSEDRDVDGRTGSLAGRMWSGFTWLTIGIDSELL